METYCVNCKKILRTKLLALEELDKIDLCLYQILLFVVRENQEASHY